MKTRLSILFVLCFQLLEAQCAMCKAVVEQGNISEAEGLNDGILYLMALPYLLLGGLFLAIAKYRRRVKK